ncbi:MAG: phage tail protein, partial [Firmicutes bacterium]|nr:phage tail protein [Bacillota bacterium]
MRLQEPRLRVYNLQRQLTGILQNAYNMKEDLVINAISHFEFSLPLDDHKNNLCKPFHYIRYDNGQLYRIMPSEQEIDETGGIQYKCEHVLALLIGRALAGEHVVGNIGMPTDVVINWVLDKQNKTYDLFSKSWNIDPRKSVDWVLGECDFSRQFEYGWQKENCLRALFSIANRFVENYIWTFDTNVYPYIINLKKIDQTINPEMYIRGGKNQIKLVKSQDPTSIVTRIIPYGVGEGDNQLTVNEVNNNISYIESPSHIIDEYGLIETQWIDRRYEDPQSLLESAQVMLEAMQEPYEEYKVDFTILGKSNFDIPELGKIVELIDLNKRTFITGIKYDYEEILNSQLTIANKSRNIAGTVAELMDRQRIEMAYAQGSTTIFQVDARDNAQDNFPCILRIMFFSDLIIINKVVLDIEITAAIIPFTSTGGGGGQTVTQSNTTSSGASSTTT